MNGIEVARELQKIPETAHIPVIAWTAGLSREATSRYVGKTRFVRLH
jgi:CheY-like chemotaxis protein